MPSQIDRARCDTKIALARDVKLEQNFISFFWIFLHISISFSLHEARKIVIWCCGIADLLLAHVATVDDHPPFLRVLIDADRLHHPKTQR